MIQDIEPKVYQSQFNKKYPNISDTLIYMVDRSILMLKDGEEYHFPTFKNTEIASHFNEDGSMSENVWKDKVRKDYKDMELLRTIGIDEEDFYLIDSDDIFSKSENFEMVSTEILRHFKPLYKAFAVATVSHLYRWRQSNVFCGKCGKKMKPSESDRALECMECGNVVFPRISPAVTVNIINNNKILLVRNNGGPFKRFAQVAGYVEIGESFEDTVKREVFEEVGLRVKNIKYYKNQPWGLSDTQMIGYTCELSGDDKFKIQEDEIQEARWFSADEIPPDIADRSLTYEMIGNFRRKFIEQTGETGKYHEFEHLFDRDIYKTQQ